MNVWIKPGNHRQVSCLGVQYRFGPFNDGRANQEVAEGARALQQHAAALLSFNGLRICGVGPLGATDPDFGQASHVLTLRSASGRMEWRTSTVFLFVQAELTDRLSQEVVFRGDAYYWINGTEVAVSKLLSRPLNSLSEAKFVSIEGNRLRYAVEKYRGNVITD